ncbi:hypothetical protein K502DRAFT_326286 [Neoconidiobolus thromboides FSU 785]|nr:hypothetical protein K502DRAFT_326286 [Neoconidiobolus thromboides FSU 785]
MFSSKIIKAANSFKSKGAATFRGLENKSKSLTQLRAQTKELKSIHLYRKALREVSQFPIPNYKNKLQYNVRELFELYRYERGQSKLESLWKNAEHDIEFLAVWKHLKEEDLKLLFKKNNNNIG